MVQTYLKPAFVLLLLFSANKAEFKARNMDLLFIQSDNKAVVDPTLTVTQLTPASIYMNWNTFGTHYTVTVIDLTANKTLTCFETTNTNATVGGLISGHSYRCSVADGGPLITIDVVVS